MTYFYKCHCGQTYGYFSCPPSEIQCAECGEEMMPTLVPAVDAATVECQRHVDEILGSLDELINQKSSKVPKLRLLD